jgi:hypothetical protein
MDVPSFIRRTVLPVEYIDFVENLAPGFTALNIRTHSSTINAQLAKRYKRPGVLPFGQAAPTLLASGTTPPSVSLSGRPTMGAYLMVIQVTTGGPLGTAVIEWSSDGGNTFQTNVTTASTIVLGTTGMTATFAAGTYATDNVYAAEPPVPGVVLAWLDALVSVDVLRKRGTNSNDPPISMVWDDAKRAREEIQQAANSKDGLWDLPASDDATSAISAGGPLFYSETSPYVYSDEQARRGREEDFTGHGRYGGGR